MIEDVDLSPSSSHLFAIQVLAVDKDVGEETTVAIDAVLAGIGDQDRMPPRRHLTHRARRCLRSTLDWVSRFHLLWSVDPNQPNVGLAATVSSDEERVAVDVAKNCN